MKIKFKKFFFIFALILLPLAGFSQNQPKTTVLNKQTKPSTANPIVQKANTEKKIESGVVNFRDKIQSDSQSVRHVFAEKQLSPSSIKPTATAVHKDSTLVNSKVVKIIKSKASLVPSAKKMTVTKVKD